MKNLLPSSGMTAMRFRAAVPIVFLLAVWLGDLPVRAGEPNTATAAMAINALGVELLHRAGPSNANALLSPYSIQNALAMTYAGADGVTRDEMAKVLHYPKDEAEVHRSFAFLRKALAESAQRSAKYAVRSSRYGATNDPLTLIVANRLFGQAGYDFRAPFLALAKDTYDAPFEQLDFVHSPTAATKHINDWVENRTQQRIHNLIPDGELNDLTRLVLVNAVYLEAAWAEPFSATETRPRPFHLTREKHFDVPTMSLKQELSHAHGDGFSILILPYSGKELRFLILLPGKVNGLATLEKKLTPDLLVGRAKWARPEVTLFLPKFKLEPALLPLGGLLRTLGMKSAFNMPTGSANFERIAPRRPDDYLFVAEIFHKTFLNLDENGTEAGAATVVHMKTWGIYEPVKPIEVKVDHPFLFAIQHRPSGACLFLGRVTDPR
jgi:serpin B